MDFGVFFILKEQNMDTKKVVTNETSNEVKREKVRVIPIQFFDDFPKHPFNVKMDEEMEALIESIKEFGNPAKPEKKKKPARTGVVPADKDSVMSN